MQFFLHCTNIYSVHYKFMIILIREREWNDSIKNNIFNKGNINELYADANRADAFTKLS